MGNFTGKEGEADVDGKDVRPPPGFNPDFQYSMATPESMEDESLVPDQGGGGEGTNLRIARTHTRTHARTMQHERAGPRTPRRNVTEVSDVAAPPITPNTSTNPFRCACLFHRCCSNSIPMGTRRPTSVHNRDVQQLGTTDSHAQERERLHLHS